MQKKPETIIAFILILLVLCPLSVSALERDERRGGGNPPGPAGGPGFGNVPGPAGGPGAGPRFNGGGNNFDGGQGMGNPPGPMGDAGRGNPPGPADGPGSNGQGMNSPADRNNDGRVGPVERRQARGKARERFGDKAFNSTGESSGKPAWMDNNPLKPASDSAPQENPPGPMGDPGAGMNPPGPMGGSGGGTGEDRGPRRHRPNT